ncbi:tyrosine-type recombinase/integrase [Massilia sp. TWR1-2-2]|uniref:tyrosine-type recombinase/integrase n=1 Tax=Massilia sp. TWR1-2-2 TaxID=2804584 RepID=UPI003CE78795
MAAQKLTATKIDRHKPTKNDEILADGNGLYVRFRRGVTGTISRTWMCTFKVGTKSVYIILGEHDSALSDIALTIYRLTAGTRLTLEIARRMALEVSDWRKRGLDPKQHLQQQAHKISSDAGEQSKADAALQKQQQAESLTVKNLFDAWIADGVRRKDGNAELKRSFAVNILPSIGMIGVKDVTEHDLRAVLRKLVDRGVNRTAVVMRNSLTQMFAWGRKRQPWRKLLVDGDPMELIEIEKIVSPEYDMNNQSDRVLSPAEIAELRDALQRGEDEFANAPDRRVAARPLERTTQRAIWIMLSTMCRVGELTVARWDDVDLCAGEWFIPKENVKGGLADMRIFLSPFALDQFRQLHKVTGEYDWCFPDAKGLGHLGTKSFTKQIGDRQARFKKGKAGEPRSPMKNRRSDNTLVLGAGKNGPWTPHDLRRTGATMMQALGVPLETIDRCQNHVLAGSKVRRHYLHHDYVVEKRMAWEQLGETLIRILGVSVRSKAPASAITRLAENSGSLDP